MEIMDYISPMTLFPFLFLIGWLIRRKSVKSGAIFDIIWTLGLLIWAISVTNEGYGIVLWNTIELPNWVFMLILLGILTFEIISLVNLFKKSAEQIKDNEENIKFLQSAQPLETPCTVNIIREKNFVGSAVKYTMALNGQAIGELKNGTSLSATTHTAQNVLTMTNSYGIIYLPLFFSVVSGGVADIYFKQQAGKMPYAHDRGKGYEVISPEEAAKLAENAQAAAESNQIPTEAFTPPVWQRRQTETTEMQAASDETPARALWLAAAALCVMLLTSFFAEWHINQSACVLLFYFSAGCALYLLVRGGLRHKICAGAILLLASFLRAYISEMGLFMQRTRRYMPLAPFNSRFVEIIVFYLIFSAVLCVIGIIFSLVIKNPKTKTLCAGFAGAGAILAYAFLRGDAYTIYKGILDYPLKIVFFGNLIPAMVYASVFFLSLIAVNMFCNLRSRKIQTGAGHKVWFSLCVAFSTISLIIQNIIEISNRGPVPLKDNTFILFVFTSAAIVGYILLLASKRSGFLVILISIGLLFFTDILIGLNSLVRPFVRTGQLYTPALGGMGISLTMLINPFITGMTLIGAWKIVPNEPPHTKREVSGIFKVFYIVGLACSIGIFFVGALNIYGVFEFASRQIWVFLVFVVAGAAIAYLQGFCLADCFGKNSRAPAGLLITGAGFAIAASIMVLIMTGGLIVAAIG